MCRTISPDDFKSLLATDRDAILFDVRRKGDYDADRQVIPGAIWLDPERIAQWSVDLPKDREVVLYCVRGGSVSNAVVDRLREQGVNARFIEGGIEAWKGACGATEQK